MVGNLVTRVAGQCRAEAGDLCGYAPELRADDVRIWLMKDLVFDTTVRAVRHRDGQHRQDRLGEGSADEVPPARAAKRSGRTDQ